MNGVRSTFMRRGYLLTALAAAVLLAASSGTALAQGPSISFGSSSGTLAENASVAPTTPAPLMLEVRRGGDLENSQGVAVDFGTINLNLGGAPIEFTAQRGGDLSGTTLTFDTGVRTIVLQGLPATAADDDNWRNEEFVIEVNSSLTAVDDSGGRFALTMDDAEDQPTVSFTKSSIALTEDSSTNVRVKVDVGRGETRPDDAIDDLSATDGTNTVRFVVSPANAFAAANMGGVATIDGATALGASSPGVYQLTDAGGTTPVAISALNDGLGTTVTSDDGHGLTITALPDMSGFQDPHITLTFDSRSLNAGANGTILAGSPLMIMIHSDEPIPTLSFSPTDVTIDEGGSVDTVLIAEGAHGSEVGMVKLMVEGDADVSLMQGDEMLEEMDGHVYVDLGTSNSARLTAMSHESRELADGDMAYKAWKLVEGSTDGAMIGEGSWFKVDVVGSTAVPALPLIGQLLLALFLMAGGSRLYRRRQG